MILAGLAIELCKVSETPVVGVSALSFCRNYTLPVVTWFRDDFRGSFLKLD